MWCQASVPAGEPGEDNVVGPAEYPLRDSGTVVDRLPGHGGGVEELLFLLHRILLAVASVPILKLRVVGVIQHCQSTCGGSSQPSRLTSLPSVVSVMSFMTSP